MTDTKTILVLGANAGQMDLVKYMQEIGWTVHACAHRHGDPGEAQADMFHLLDIRDTDAVTELARTIKADLVYSVSSDIAMTSAVKVSEALSLPRFYDSEFITLLDKKELLRAYLNKHGLGPVAYQTIRAFEDIDNWTAFPCMVKPSDAQGQRGVQKITDSGQFEEAVKIALESSASHTAIVEEFLDGVEMSCNVLICNGKLEFDILSERLVHTGELFGIPEGHLVPCINVPDNVQQEALQLVRDTVNSFGIENGCLYFQMMASRAGVRIIEIAPRLDGCHVWRLILHATGKNFLASTVQCLLGQLESGDRATVPQGALHELIFQQTSPDRTFHEKDFPVPEDVYYHEYRYRDGDSIQPINGKMEVVGYYVRAYGPNRVQEHKNREV